MEPTIQSFKGDLLGAIWNHGLRIVKPSIVVSVIMFFVSMGLIMLGFGSMLDWDFNLMGELMSGGDPLESQMVLQGIMMEYVDNPIAVMKSFGLVFIVIVILQAIVYALLLKMSGNVAYGESDSVSAAWSKVTSRHIGNVIVYFIIMGVIYLVLGLIVGLLVTVTHPMLMFILAPLLALTMMRFMNVVPALILGNKSIGEAFMFSWESITYKRALLIFVGGFVVGVIMIIVLMIVGFITSLLGVIGVAISIVFQLAINVFTMALTIAFFTAIYYRYAIVEGDDTQVESIGTE